MAQVATLAYFVTVVKWLLSSFGATMADGRGNQGYFLSDLLPFAATLVLSSDEARSRLEDIVSCASQ